MKKIITLLFIIMVLGLMSCQSTTTTEATTTTQQQTTEIIFIDCIPGYSWDRNENICILNPDAYILDENDYTAYKVQYIGYDYTVYRTYMLLGYDNDVVVDMGVYNDFHYFFSSDTHYNYYLVEKNDTNKKLKDAIESDWFSLEDLVNLFGIPQLQSEEIS